MKIDVTQVEAAALEKIVILDPTTWRWPTVPEVRKFLVELGCDEATPVHHLSMV